MKKKDKRKEKEKEKEIEKLTIKLHNIRTRIKKFKNNLNNSIKITATISIVVLFCNAVLSYCYFGIYRNSFWCILVNVLTSIGYNILISLIINLLESLSKCNCKRALFFLYMPLCTISYYIINKLCCKREEYNDLDEEDNNLSDDDNNQDNSKNNLKDNRTEDTLIASINNSLDE